MSRIRSPFPRIRSALRRSAPRRTVHDDRGDVPGWVLVTLMTAGLVIVIWGLAGPALSDIFNQAVEQVTGF